MTVSGAVTGEIFAAYLSQVLGPTLVPGDVVVLDNLPAHKVAGLVKLVEARGARLLYLPPYSTDFNPIELACSKLKAWLRPMQQYYLAGRICSGQLMLSSPPDFWNLSAIITGNTGSVQLAADLNAKVQQAKTAKGWCVFLTHGINDDGGYSPTQSTELAAHLAYVNTNSADYWVATFADAVKYIKERNAVLVTETTVPADELSLVVADNLVDALYNVPITVRRQLPTTWPAATVTQGATQVTATVTTVGTAKYLVFKVVPDQGPLRLAKAAVVTGTASAAARPDMHLQPNLFPDTINLETQGAFTYAIYALHGKLVQTGQGLGTLALPNTLAQGAYVVKISQNGQLVSTKIIKYYGR